ncbi:MAG TPA: alpha/beta fold hydrolase [Acidimicrobiales bacterium]|nr:alpha/beta fold hydrolase [Acidimicrobiales bacterium]
MGRRRDPEPPLPPPLPAGRVEVVPGRGEMFFRETPAPPGSPVVVLLHGWTASADLNWLHVYGDAARFGHVIAVDHRGHGRGIRSEEPFSLEAAADDVAALLDHLGLGPAVVAGYSMGGPLSVLLWQRHRRLVSGLVLAATALEWRASTRERAVWRIMRAFEWLFRLGLPRNVLERYLRAAFEECPELEPWRGWLVGELRRGDPVEVAEAGRALSRWDFRPAAGSVDVPAAVVLTTRDRLVRPRKQRALARAIPGAVVVPVDGDHDAALVRPSQWRAGFTEALGAVVAQTRAGTEGEAVG